MSDSQDYIPSITKDNIRKSLGNIQNQLDDIINSDTTPSLPPVMELFSRMYWATVFLDFPDLARFSAGARALIHQQKNTDSGDGIDDLKAIIQHTKLLVKQRQSDIVQQDTVHSSEKNILTLFEKRKINLDQISLYHELPMSKKNKSQSLLTLPGSVKGNHDRTHHLILVSIKLEEQKISFSEFSSSLTEALEHKEILLHGTLVPPRGDSRRITYKAFFYMLISIAEDAETWFASRQITGHVLKTIYKPVNSFQKVENKVEGMTNQTNSLLNSTAAPASNTSTKNQNHFKIRFPVSAKLIIIVSLITITAITTISFASLYLFRNELKNRIEDTNIALSSSIATQVEHELINIFNSANLLLQMTAINSDASNISDFFSNFTAFIHVAVLNRGITFTNKEWFLDHLISNEDAIIQEIFDVLGQNLQSVLNGETIVLNVSQFIPNIDSPTLMIGVPVELDNVQEVMVIIVDISSNLAQSVVLNTGISTTILVNSNGDILAHPDFTRVYSGENIKSSPIFSRMYSTGTTSGQIRFQESSETGVSTVIGAFTIISSFQLAAVSTVLEEDAFSVINKIQFLSLNILGFILSLAFLGIIIFAQRLSGPLKELTLATQKIRTRNYDISIKPRTRDEVGVLTQNFVSMIPELEKVDRLQERTSKFVNAQVAQMIAEDTLPDRAKTKDVTVFFSDIRGYTSISEAMGDPQRVLDNLSEYFQVMVPCVQDTKGTVDKFIGDAIMAVWGSMEDLPNNAESAVNSALMMRVALKEFNIDRGDLYKPVFHIGCGLNSGPTTVGIMGGGSAKEEWTHMGDTVNLASRIESLNKVMGTDILISESTAQKVAEIFDLVPMKKIKLKGKSQLQRVYAVLGRLDDDSRPRTLEELRTFVGIEYEKTKGWR